MKLRFEFFQRQIAVLVVLLMGRMLVHAGSPPAAPAKGAATAGQSSTNLLEIPLSVFVVNSSTQPIKDPFFPNSTRINATPTPSQTKRPVAATGELALQGLSGSSANPLATINDRTLAPGEETDVRTPSGKVHVRCVEISLKDETVIVDVGGERRVLRFSRRR